MACWLMLVLHLLPKDTVFSRDKAFALSVFFFSLPFWSRHITAAAIHDSSSKKSFDQSWLMSGSLQPFKCIPPISICEAHTHTHTASGYILKSQTFCPYSVSLTEFKHHIISLKKKKELYRDKLTYQAESILFALFCL